MRAMLIKKRRRQWSWVEVVYALTLILTVSLGRDQSCLRVTFLEPDPTRPDARVHPTRGQLW